MFSAHQVILKFVKSFIFLREKKNTVDHAELAYSNHSRWLLNKHVCWQQVGGELEISNTFYEVWLF